MSKIKFRYGIEKMYFPVDGYTHNAQVYTSVDAGKTYYYCGIGRFTKSEDEAIEYCKEHFKKQGGNFDGTDIEINMNYGVRL